jgi:hypothetical protein
LNYDGDGYNTAVGYAAGTAVTTGIENTIVGGRAGDALTTGQENAVIGQHALSADTAVITQQPLVMGLYSIKTLPLLLIVIIRQ